MRFEIIGKNGYVPTKKEEEYIKKRLEKPINVFNPDWILSVTVVLKQYKDRSKVEVTIPGKGITLRSEASEADMFRAIDKTRDKLMTQIRRHKTKLTNHLAKKGVKDIYADTFEVTPELEAEERAKKIVKSKKFTLTPMTVDQAIVEMEMTGHDFYVFLNKETDKVNVCYIREDGNYAIIETNE